ncbi:hypothetical protein [Streptomyces sp. NPDC048202]
MSDVVTPTEADQIMSELSGNEEVPGKVNAESALEVISNISSLGA